MAHNSTRRVRKQKGTINVPLGWGTPFLIEDLEVSGILARIVLRGEPGATIDRVDFRLYSGMYDETTAPDLVPGEDIILSKTGIVINGHAVKVDIDENLLLELGGVPYTTVEPGTSLWLALKGTLGLGTADINFSLEAVDVE